MTRRGRGTYMVLPFQEVTTLSLDRGTIEGK